MLSQSSWLCVVLSDSVSSYFGEMLWKKAVITPITVFMPFKVSDTWKVQISLLEVFRTLKLLFICSQVESADAKSANRKGQLCIGRK